MNLKTISLSDLNRQSKRNAFKLDDLALASPDRKLFWAPEELVPISHLQEYELLSLQERIRYNQLFALGVLEQFIWLESRVLCRVIEKVLRDRSLPRDLKIGLTHFHEDEVRHSEMFWRMLEIAEPKLYSRRECVFLSSKSFSIKAVESLIEAPSFFLVWIWLAIFFEERTLDFSKRYILQYKTHPDSIDQSFFLVHKLHMQDELRHFMMDVHLLRHFYDEANVLKKNLASRMFSSILKRLANPRLMTLAYLKKMNEEFEGFESRVGRRLRLARASLRTNNSFKSISMSAASTPRTYELLDRYRETRHLRKHFSDLGGQKSG